jgi:hypothetical protein
MYQLFLWRLYLMVLRGATSLRRALGPNGTRFARAISGPKKVSIFRATPSNAPRNDVAPLKTITYRAIKTTGTLIVKNNFIFEHIVIKLSKYGFGIRDPEKNLFRSQILGQKAPDPGSRIRNTAFSEFVCQRKSHVFCSALQDDTPELDDSIADAAEPKAGLHCRVTLGKLRGWTYY